MIPALAGQAASRASGPSDKFSEYARQIEESQPSNSEADPSRRKRRLSRLKMHRIVRVLTSPHAAGSHGIEERQAALGQLGESGDPRALEIILPQLNDSSRTVVEAAIAALGELKNPAALPVLLRQLDSDFVELRRAAMAAMGRLGDSRAVRPLLAFAHDHPQLRLPVTEAVLDIGEPAVAPLLDALDDSDAAVVQEAVVLLGRRGEKKAVRPLMSLVQTAGSTLRLRAIEALGQLADPRALPTLWALLRDPDPQVRAAVPAALANMPDAKSVDPLVAALNDPEISVRIRAAAALGEIADPRAAGPLGAALAVRNEDLRLAVADALGKIGDGRAVEPLISLLESGNESILNKAIVALKRTRDPRAVHVLTRFLTDPREPVRLRAVDALGQIGDAATAERLERVLRTDRSEEIRALAAKALGEIGEPGSLAALEMSLHDETSVRCQAIAAMGAVGDEAALPALLAMLKEPAPEIRYNAALALAQIGNKDSIEHLRGRVLDDTSDMVRRGAVKALERLGDPIGKEWAEHKRLPRRRRLKSASVSLLAGLTPSLLAAWWPESRRGRIIAASAPLVLLIAIAGLLAYKAGPGQVREPHGDALCLSFSPDGRRIAVGRTRGWIEIWDVATGEQVSEHRAGETLSAVTELVLTGPDSFVFASGAVLRLVHTEQDEARELASGGQRIVGLAATPDRRTLALRAADGQVVLRDGPTGEHAGALSLPPGALLCFEISPDGKLIAGGDRAGTVTLWKAPGGTVEHKFAGLKQPVTAVAFSPDGKFLAAGCRNGSVAVWEIDARKQTALLPPNKPLPVKHLKFVPGTGSLAFTKGAAVEVWDAGSDKPPRMLDPTDADSYRALDITPDGRHLAAAGEKRDAVWLFETATGRLVRTLAEE